MVQNENINCNCNVSACRYVFFKYLKEVIIMIHNVVVIFERNEEVRHFVMLLVYKTSIIKYQYYNWKLRVLASVNNCRLYLSILLIANLVNYSKLEKQKRTKRSSFIYGNNCVFEITGKIF